jgi:hypothetical protein
MLLAGLKVIVDDCLGWESERLQTRFPRSKKRRIRKKFAKDRRNFTVRQWQKPVCYRTGVMLIMNKPALAALKSQAQP